MNTAEILISAIRAQFKKGAPLPEGIDFERLKAVLALSKQHDMAHIAALSLMRLSSGEIKTEFSKQKMLAVFRREQLDYEEERISAVLEENGILFIPLKGAVIKDYYPERWMRTSSDIDILVHPEDAEKATELITQKLEYSFKGKSLHDIQLYSKSGVHFELHFDMPEAEISESIWSYARPEKGVYRQEVSAEFLIFHTILHAKYHFSEGGCGIKPFLDFWVLDNRLDYDENILFSLLKETGSEKFFTGFKALTDVWFEEEKHTPLTIEMERYILSGGVYGSKENYGKAKVHSHGGRKKYYLSRIFKSRQELTAQFPRLEKRPWLLPFYQVRRWFNIFSSEKRRELKAESKGSAVKNTGEMFDILGIK